MESRKKITTKFSSKSESSIIFNEMNSVVTITLNRPKKFNALTEEMLTALQKILDNIVTNKSIRIVILQGAGKAFCGGHDLKEMIATREESYYKNLFLKCSKIMMTINNMPQPVIAKVHGIATAAGCQLVAACDLAVASEDASFATSGINVGLFCSTPSVPVSRNVPRKKAMELLLTGEFIDAKTALNWGLINRVAPLIKLDKEVNKLAEVILSKPSIAVFTGKKMFYKQLERHMEEAYNYAAKIMASNMMADEVEEGINFFVQKNRS